MTSSWLPIIACKSGSRISSLVCCVARRRAMTRLALVPLGRKDRALLRQRVLDELVRQIDAIHRPHPVRVAIDGIDAGKTTLADELTLALLARQRAVIRASIDGFHRPRAERYRLGSESSIGYYEDSFNYESLQKLLLLPLGPGGHRKYRRVAFDLHQNAPATIPVETATSTAVLLMDGVFLLRPELNYYWDTASSWM
jgi:uridine kinase